jgi:hypothetical protein
MAEIKHILILANSEREGGRCIAGKIAEPIGDGKFDIGQQWIRLNYPDSITGGAAPPWHTYCRPDKVPIRPLDFIKITLLNPCSNPDHPEDWNYDPNMPWEWAGEANYNDLTSITDTPPALWHDGNPKAVHAGYIQKMKQPASLYLIKAPPGYSLQYFKEWIQKIGRDKKRRRLKMNFGGKYHDFSVTDSRFDTYFNLPDAASHWPGNPTTLTMPNPDEIYFCLSLTGLTPPDFVSHHYKICATILVP